MTSCNSRNTRIYALFERNDVKALRLSGDADVLGTVCNNASIFQRLKHSVSHHGAVNAPQKRFEALRHERHHSFSLMDSLEDNGFFQVFDRYGFLRRNILVA